MRTFRCDQAVLRQFTEGVKVAFRKYAPRGMVIRADKLVTATITHIDAVNKKLTVEIERKKGEGMSSDLPQCTDTLYGMFLALDLTTYMAWRQNLDVLRNSIPILHESEILQQLFMQEEHHISDQPLQLLTGTTHLNQAQEKALLQSLDSTLTIIHGPPGTGKSTVLTSIIENIVLNKKRVLVCAVSNAAVDQLLELVLRSSDIPDIRSLTTRFGKSARISPSLQDLTVESKIQAATLKASNDAQSEVQASNDAQSEVQAYNDAQSEVQASNDAQSEVQASNDAQSEVQASNDAQSEVQASNDAQSEVQASNDAQSEVQAYAFDLLDPDMLRKILNDSRIVACTLTIASTFSCDDFDYVIIDEAAQATEVACLGAIMKGSQLVLAGDHLQLPPVVHCQKGKDCLEMTLFERCVFHKGKISWLPDVHPSLQERVVLLDVQYRMNQHIMSWSSKNLYNGKLKAAEGVANQVLADTYLFEHYPILKQPWIFVDTHGMRLEQSYGHGQVNPGEIDIVLQFLRFFAHIGLPMSEIGIVSPYNAQVKAITRALSEIELPNVSDVEVKSIDGFQGSEKTVIILSCVRSNYTGKVGFLNEKRRMNVAITRAKKMVCIIGDRNTLEKDEFLRGQCHHHEQWTVLAADLHLLNNDGLVFAQG